MSTLRSTSTPNTGHMGQTMAGNTKPLQERIAMRAYEKWVKRGCNHGCDLQDWVEAEKEVMAEQGRSTTPATGMRR